MSKSKGNWCEMNTTYFMSCRSWSCQRGWESSFFIDCFDTDTLGFLCNSYKYLILSEKGTNTFLILDTPTHLQGYTYRDTPTGIHLQGYTYRDTPTGDVA